MDDISCLTPSELLSDEGLFRLAQEADEGAQSFTAFLDNVTGIAEARYMGHKDMLHENALVYGGGRFYRQMCTNDMASLQGALVSGDVLERVTAALAILRLPLKSKSLVPTELTPEVHRIVQRQLSRDLVDHPVLFHPRIIVHSFWGQERERTHIRAEKGPIATVIACTPTAELPRIEHGVDPDKLRRFASHHCVRAAFTQLAPKPDGRVGSVQGTMLFEAMNSHWPHNVKLVTSLAELDELRIKGVKKPPARLLPPPTTLKGLIEPWVRSTAGIAVLQHAGIFVAHLSPERRPPNALLFSDGGLAHIARSGFAKEKWLLAKVEAYLHALDQLPDHGAVAAAVRKLGETLIELNPRGLTRSEFTSQATGEDFVRWFATAATDKSVERAHLIGTRALAEKQCMKPLDHVIGGVLDGLQQVLVDTPIEDRETEVVRILEDELASQTGNSSTQEWFAALLACRMKRVIAQVRPAQPAPAVPAHRRSQV